jgi:hypothetical protein
MIVVLYGNNYTITKEYRSRIVPLPDLAAKLCSPQGLKLHESCLAHSLRLSMLIQLQMDFVFLIPMKYRLIKELLIE